MPREMTETEIREFLAHGTRTAKLATVGRGGAPHVMPVWFVLDGGQLVLTTGAESVKGRNLRRDPRVAVVVDDETPPFAFVHIRGRAALSEDPGELLVLITPERVISKTDLAGYGAAPRSVGIESSLP